MTSDIARLGAVCLLGLGLLMAGVVAYAFVTSRSSCGPDGYRFACDLSNIAVVIGAGIAAVHLVAAAGLWRGQLWGALLGIAIAALGTLAWLAEADEEPLLLVVPAAAGYLGTLLVLLLAVVQRSNARFGHARPRAQLPPRG